MYAKELVRVRNQQKKLIMSKAQLGSISHRTTTVKATHTMSKAMEGAAKAMATSNKAMSPQKVQASMRSFQVAQERMAMTDEM
jgi:charged multivesicular body protein 2A